MCSQCYAWEVSGFIITPSRFSNIVRKSIHKCTCKYFWVYLYMRTFTLYAVLFRVFKFFKGILCVACQMFIHNPSWLHGAHATFKNLILSNVPVVEYLKREGQIFVLGCNAGFYLQGQKGRNPLCKLSHLHEVPLNLSIILE